MRLVAASAAALVISAAAVTASAGPAMADTNLPFHDRRVAGTLTFCDKNHHAVTHGDIRSHPFVWTAVSSMPTPPGYAEPMGKATLMAYQPREKVDPGEWSGVQLTASSLYTNPKAPMAQSVTNDPPLLDFVSIAPGWQGLVQLRMYFSNYDMTPYSSTYPAAVIRVKGNTWTLVSGGGTSCSGGHAVSSGTLRLTPTLTGDPVNSKATEGVVSAPAATGAQAGATGPSGDAASPAAMPEATVPAQDSNSVGAAETTGGAAETASEQADAVPAGQQANPAARPSTSTWAPALLLGLLGVVAGAAGALVVMRRNRTAPPDEAAHRRTP